MSAPDFSFPLICPTAGGFLIHQHRLLLVKHKKLGIWLAPGGHLELDESPEQAAEREVFEETGIKVKTVTKIFTNLHWVCRDNYLARIASDTPHKPHTTPLWPRGCEQHLGDFYLVQPLERNFVPKLDPSESDALDWFGPDQIDTLATTASVKSEIQAAFALSQQIFN